MENKIIPIHFNGRGIEYKGWVMPSKERHEDGHPKHYRVVLNDVFSANFWLNRGKWFADEPWMQDMAVEIGVFLDRLTARHRAAAF
jgi:hypothetical protein